MILLRDSPDSDSETRFRSKPIFVEDSRVSTVLVAPAESYDGWKIPGGVPKFGRFEIFLLRVEMELLPVGGICRQEEATASR